MLLVNLFNGHRNWMGDLFINSSHVNHHFIFKLILTLKVASKINMQFLLIMLSHVLCDESVLQVQGKPINVEWNWLVSLPLRGELINCTYIQLHLYWKDISMG